jgi:protocatechuate 3,4-dioxygenase beta subunit
VNLTFPQRNVISGLVRSFEGALVEGAFVAASPGNYSTLTDSAGRYTLRVLPGAYSVSVSKVGYSSPPAQTVTAPPDRANVDFTFLQAYVIGGRVRDFDGSPVADVAINASPGGYAATTDAAGLYTLTVPSGAYDVSAVKPDYPALRSQRVTVPPSRTDVHFNFPQRATIGGTVRDGAGSPVSDVLVSASPGGYLAFTDASGHYTLHVVAGTYVVTVSKTGYPSPSGRTISVPPSRDDLDFAFLETYAVSGAVREFDGSPVANVDVMASPGAHITRTDATGAYTLNLSSGTYSVSISKSGYPALPPRTITVPPSQTQVNFDYPQRFSISGAVRDFDGTVVVEAVVTANPGGYSTLTDAQGTYSLSVVAGVYQVRAAKTGYQIPPEQTVTVPPSRSNVDFTFPERLSLGGAVRDFDGSPLPGALVSANPGGYVGSTDPRGIYTITLLAGTYTVTVSMGGYPPPDGRVVTLPPSQRDVDFLFPQRYRIAGHARDDAGMPLADVIISTRPGSFITSTLANGEYSLYVLAGTYTLTASKAGYPGPPTQSITVPPERDDLDWVFPRRFQQFLPYIARSSRR